ncbi:MAG: LacI family DNA-binding transcriptional regulator [Planctomycetota bacterium]|jgi:LacI family transcriptional regulator|nr:LacI family DNA-binding transcriptional regulator [Planctomycetota bacterium]
MTSINDVAAAAGVSVASVSRVFNKRPNVRPEVAERVLASARSLGYRPRQSARRDCVAVVVPSLQLGTYGSMLAGGITGAAQQREWRIELVTPEALPQLQGGLVSGVVAAVTGHDASLRQLSGVPVVTLNTPVNDLPCVRSADRAAVFDAVTHLHQRGHRRIGLITVDAESYANVQRRTGYADGLRRASLKVDAALIARCRYPDTTLEVCRRLLAAKPDAVIATGEHAGPQVAHALYHLGVRLGEDLSFVTHEYPGVSCWQTPAHTTIAQDFTALAEACLARLAGECDDDDIVVPCQLHQRDSVRTRGIP